MRFFRLLLIGLSLAFVAACSSNATPASNNEAQNTIVPQAIATTAPDPTADPANAEADTSTDAQNAVAAQPTAIPADTNTDAATNVDNTGLVARVNDVGITRAEFDEAVARLNNPDIASMEAREREALRNLIDQELIRQGATSLGINITDADVQAEIAELRDLAGDNWDSFLQQNNLTEETLFDAQRDQLLTLAVRDALIAPYQEEIEQVNARHILVQTRPEAMEVLTRLQNGEGFAALAAEYSIDATSRDRGGNLGWFARNELFQKNLEDEAFALEVGQMRGPIETELGFHILQLMDKQVRLVEPERLPTLQDLVYNEWIEEQRNAANIQQFISW